MRRLFGTLSFIFLGIQLANAVTINGSKCVVLFDDKERLECFDKAVKDVIGGKTPPVPPSLLPQQPPSSATENIAAEHEFKVVDPWDVASSPDRWQYKPIQFNRVQVYWVEDDDVRLITQASLTVFSLKILGKPEIIQHYKTNCATAKEALSSKCRAKVRFFFFQFGSDAPTGLIKRTTLMTRGAELIRDGR